MGGANPKKSKVEEQDQKNREREQTIATIIKKLNPEQTVEKLEDLANRWKLYDASATFETQTIHMFMALGVDFNDDLMASIQQDRGSFGMRQVDDKIRESEIEAISLYHRLRELNLLPDKMNNNVDKSMNLKKITKILEMIFYSKKVVLSAFQAKLAVHQLEAEDGIIELDQDLDTQLGSWALRFRFIDGDVSSFQELLLFLLDSAMEKKYRKAGDWLYEPIIIDGRDMHSWRAVSEIKDFVYSRLRKEVSWEQWKNATQNMKNVGSAVEYLTNCHDHQLPFLHKSRGVYSFYNGVYIAPEDRFHCFETEKEPLSDSIVASKFVEGYFDNTQYADWFDIPTPHLDSIMKYQEWDQDVQRWLFALLGRILYPVNQVDSWQVIPFFKGLAATGKSTIILKVIKNFFETVDVGILSNNVERKFGISAFHDKYCVLAPEIKSDLAIEQAEFQSMVSGEDVQVNVKHKKAFAEEWSVPMALAGNEVPGWADNGGSIQRRMVVFEFKKPVRNGDMKLGEKLDKELPFIIRKCNKAYLDLAGKHSDVNIWSVLPEYFINTREALARATNFIESFMASGDVILGENEICPFGDFKSALREHATMNVMNTKQLTADVFTGPFEKYGIKYLGTQTMEYCGQSVNTEFIQGLSLKSAKAKDANLF
ncbi:Phage/plasmid primase, ATPase, superfamily III helicase [Only Syngen Nebraska virus 5]|uniref:Phage/plasmid primase, ATPase, superfamily III helicase n=1 Tax=Only Syngen Nebraska virus 5 TaxID=1917232 RepID=UPI000901E364|nr:Phage/plasmid primase, ATPase, superfamily III helicase [Only Syngen Nebraska virus 5]APC25751.1 Phage/plasmid primase, ATPase, superfamily III helicase [Only Syngen Nebraska virus 5]